MIGSSIVTSTEDGLTKLSRQASSVLVAVAGLTLAAAALQWVAADADARVLAPSIVMAVVYGVLAAWATKDPLPPVVTGFALHVANGVGAILLNPALAMSLWNLLLQAILLAAFLNGLNAAGDHRRLKVQLHGPPA